MKLRINLILVLMISIASFALARDRNAVDSSAPQPKSACAFGSCFVPNFDFAGDFVQYAGPGASGPVRFEYADCCNAGDGYQLIVKNPQSSTATISFKSVGSLNADCSLGPYADSQAVEVRGAASLKYKAVALPGGAPAGAYIRISQGSWTQTVGSDQCGF